MWHNKYEEFGLKESEEHSFLNRKLTRREFGIEVASLLGLSALSGRAAYEILSSSENLTSYDTNVFTADFGPDVRWKEELYNITQPYRPDNKKLLTRLLGEGYPDQTELVFDAVQSYLKGAAEELPSREEDRTLIESIVDISLQNRTIPTLIELACIRFFKHSTDLAKHKENVLRVLGLRSSKNFVVPVQRNINSVVNPEGGRSWRNSEDLLGTRIRLDGKGTTNDLRDYAGRWNVLALPLQFGTVGFYHQPNPLLEPGISFFESLKRRVQMEGAYSEEFVDDSLLELAIMVNDLQIVTIAVLGNTLKDQIDSGVKKLKKKGKWPDELIIFAGEALLHRVEHDDLETERKWKYKSWYGSYGSPEETVFVDNYAVGVEYMREGGFLDQIIYGGSAATWTTALYADLLIRKGVKPKNVKETILSSVSHVKDIEGRDMNVIPNLDILKQIA